MKLIKVTQKNKANNPKLFGTRAIGSIARLSGRDVVNGLPNAYIGIEKVDGGYMHRTELHEQDGFFDEQMPTLNDATQYLGELFFDEVNKVFTKQLLNFTQAEIDANGIKVAKDEFKNNLEGVFAYATTPDGTKEYAIKIGNDGKIVTVLIP